MPNPPQPTNSHRHCADISRLHGEDPIGTASPADAFLVIEQPLPWARKVEQTPSFPAGVAESVAAAKKSRRRVRLLAVAPDRARSQPGRRRVLFFSRPADPVAVYDREEFVVAEAAVPPLVEALLGGFPPPSGIDAVRLPAPGGRDLLVCTHGTRDACCATFGFPTYAALHRLSRQLGGGELRVWRSSHLGGHRFAATLLDLPEGRVWGHLAPPQLAPLALRDGPAALLVPRYRGWAALDDPFLQAAEREILAREGWRWTAAPVSGRVLAVDPRSRHADVRLDRFDPAGGLAAVYRATVEPAAPVATLGSCGGDVEQMPQYRVTRLVIDHASAEVARSGGRPSPVLHPATR